jgi:hypothetical protein
MIITTEQKYDMISQRVTLNGKPAKISGARRQFAMVATLNSEGASAEFAWSTVARIVAAGGKFKA